MKLKCLPQSIRLLLNKIDFSKSFIDTKYSEEIIKLLDDFENVCKKYKYNPSVALDSVDYIKDELKNNNPNIMNVSEQFKRAYISVTWDDRDKPNEVIQIIHNAYILFLKSLNVSSNMKLIKNEKYQDGDIIHDSEGKTWKYRNGVSDEKLDYDVNEGLDNRERFYAYKMFRTKFNPNNKRTWKEKGRLYPLYINASNYYEIGPWYKCGYGASRVLVDEFTHEPLYDKNGEMTVKTNEKGLAFRPGGHSGGLPLMRQRGRKDLPHKGDNDFDYFHSQEVFAVIEFSGHYDYTDLSKEKQKNSLHPDDPYEAGFTDINDINQEGKGMGYYHFKTNTNAPDDEDWFIASAFRIVRVINDIEMNDIIIKYNKEHGTNFEPQKRGNPVKGKDGKWKTGDAFNADFTQFEINNSRRNKMKTIKSNWEDDEPYPSHPSRIHGLGGRNAFEHGTDYPDIDRKEGLHTPDPTLLHRDMNDDEIKQYKNANRKLDDDYEESKKKQKEFYDEMKKQGWEFNSVQKDWRGSLLKSSVNDLFGEPEKDTAVYHDYHLDTKGQGIINVPYIIEEINGRGNTAVLTVDCSDGTRYHTSFGIKDWNDFKNSKNSHGTQITDVWVSEEKGLNSSCNKCKDCKNDGECKDWDEYQKSMEYPIKDEVKEVVHSSKEIKSAINEGWEVKSTEAGDALEMFKEVYGEEETIEALSRAMGDDELSSNLKYIFRTWDIGNYDDFDSVWDAFEYAKDSLGVTELLNSLEKAMDTDTLAENLAFIFRQYDFRDWENRSSIESEYDPEHDSMEDAEIDLHEGETIEHFPTWALNYAMYGEDESLSQEEKDEVDQCLESNSSYTVTGTVEGSENSYDENPCFGLPCETVTVTL